MRLSVTHTTRLTYSNPVVQEVMECRLGPLSDEDQRWDRFELRVKPGGPIRSYVDGFGNPGHLVTIASSHETIELIGESQVTTLLKDPFVPPSASPRPLTPQERYDYLAPSQLISREERLQELAAGVQPSPTDEPFETAVALNELVYNQLAYMPDVTTITTTVSEVLDGQAGVCQDFTHLLIGLCRSVGIPARYVSGYLLANRDNRGPAAGASHAWAEIYSPTHGWRGFDPTNNLLAAEHHIKIAIGRDYGDVPPTRGTYRGEADSDLAVEVAVRAIP